VSADARVFRLQLALGGAGLLAALLALAAGARTVHVAPAAAHRLDVGGLRFTYPAANVAAVALFALAALGAAVLIVTVRAGWRQARAHRRLIRELPVAGPLPGHPATVIEVAAPLAFCAGWLRPRVFVSRGALERLSHDQLRAVLAHEHHHQALRDPLRLAVGRVLSHALFFLPVLRPLHDRYGDAAELAADAAAVKASGPAPLAAALLEFGAGPDGVVGISPDRVDSLLGRPAPWPLPRAALIGGLITLALLVALVWRASAGATVAATLNLPIASSQPCILVLALVPVVASLAGAISRRT
jgi:Zn-dependent protease with chaperone function